MKRRTAQTNHEAKHEVDVDRLAEFHADYAGGPMLVPGERKGDKEDLLDLELHRAAYLLGRIGTAARPSGASAAGVSDYALASKGTISKWKKAWREKGVRPRARHWALEAVFFAHGVDLSHERLFADASLRICDQFAVTQIRLERSPRSNGPDDEGRDLYALTVDQIRLKSDSFMLTAEDGRPVCMIEVWIYELHLHVGGIGGQISNLLVRLPDPMSDEQRGRTAHYVLSDATETEVKAKRLLLRAEALRPAIGSATLQGVHLCDVRLAPEETAALSAEMPAGGLQYVPVQATDATPPEDDRTRRQMLAQFVKLRRGASILQDADDDGGRATDAHLKSIRALGRMDPMKLSHTSAKPPRDA